MIAVILAAGLSKRFGDKKLLAKVNNKSMVLHVADLVSSLNFDQNIIVYSDEEVRKEIESNCEQSHKFQFFNNNLSYKGLSTSIRLAIEQLNLSYLDGGIMFFVADQPFIDATTVRKLTAAYYEGKGSIIVPVYGVNRGNPVIFSIKWLEQLKRLEGDVGGRGIIRDNPKEVREVFITDAQIGKDIDTKEEYTALQHERI
jgi:molybdenum cofactor cytidylyltransferase